MVQCCGRRNAVQNSGVAQEPKGVVQSVKKGVGALASKMLTFPAKLAGGIVGIAGSYVARNAAIQAFAITMILSNGSLLEECTEKKQFDKGFSAIQMVLKQDLNKALEGFINGAVEGVIDGFKTNYAVASAITGCVSGMLPLGNIVNGAIGGAIGYGFGNLAQNYVMPYLPEEEFVTELATSLNRVISHISPEGYYGPVAAASLGALATYIAVKGITGLAQRTIFEVWKFGGKLTLGVVKLPFIAKGASIIVKGALGGVIGYGFGNLVQNYVMPYLQSYVIPYLPEEEFVTESAT